MIKAITSDTELRDIKDIWENIYTADNSATPFQKYEYILYSWQYLRSEGESLYILMVKDNPSNKWIAIFPLVKRRKDEVRFLNAGNTDFCAPIILPGYNNYNLYEELAQYISDDKSISRLILDNLESSSPLLSALAPHLKYNLCVVSDYFSTIDIYRKDDDTDPLDAIRHIGSKRKKKLKKTLSSIGTDCVFKLISHSNNDEYPQTDIEEIVDIMIQSERRSAAFFSSDMLSLWKMLYMSGILSIAMIYENQKPVTCSFMYYNGNKNEYIKWIMLYVSPEWNMKLNIMLAQHLYLSGNQAVINFARGIYDYKLVNFHPAVKPLFRLYIAKNISGHLVNIQKNLFYNILPIIRKWAIPLIVKIQRLRQ